MYNELGSYAVPTTLKQLQNTDLLESENKNNKAAQGANLFESFGSVLDKHLKETNELSFQAHTAQETLATGGNISLHEVIIKTDKADMAMQLTMKMRNKLLEAYKEVQNMRV